MKADNAPKEENVEDLGNFQFTKAQLQALVDPKSKDQLRAIGGLSGLCSGLRVNPEFGVSDSAPTLTRIPTQSSWVSRKSGVSTINEDIASRQKVYGENTLPAKKPKSILQLMWMALQEKILILLTVAAVISLGLGIYEDIEIHNKVLDRSTGKMVDEPRVKWVEGFAIIVAIMIVVLVGSINDWQKERQFMKLNAKKEDRVVQVIRSGRQKEISVYQLVVGDVMCLEPGEIIAADGVFIEGHRLRCDESGITGESDALRKERLEDCEKNEHEESSADPFLLSGSKVLEGVGKCVVIAVGQNSIHGRTMMALSVESQDTPLQEKLNGLAEAIAKLGFAAALLMFIVLIISYFIQFARNNVDRSTPRVIESIVRIIISAVTVVVVAVPEGLPLAVTLALAFATTRMLKDNNLVRILSACETMGNATTICSDKTGTLTQNKMTVVTGTIGGESFQQPQNLPESINKDVLQQIHDSVAINSTAFEDPETKELLGNKTETALLQWIAASGADFMQLRDAQEVGQVWPFSSSRKSMNTAARRKGGSWRFHTKGAAEIILSRCTKYVSATDGSIHPMTDSERKRFLSVIEKYALQSLRNIALAYIDLDTFNPSNDEDLEFDSDLTLMAIVGIQDPLRPGVADAVLQCQRAGVFVRMVTGDNVTTAQAIAMQCHIYSDRGIVMEGPEFRAMTDQQRIHIVPRLQVLARSSPEDKKILVDTLRKTGQTVAVTGDGTNDGPALKAADIGFSMGIAGTEVAKEASSIILMDDNFASIVKAIKWGRCVNDSVRKFLQFQLTVNITAVLLTFVSAAVDYSNQTSVLSAVQLLWVNLIMDTLAALALATDPPDDELLERMPDSRSAPLISFTMWKMIIVQSVFQVIVCMGVLYGYPSLNPDVHRDPLRKAQLATWIFNIFVWLQLFNEINCRRLDNRLNIFRGIHRNFYFITIFFLTAILQVIIVEFGSVAFQTVPLPAAYWGTSIAIGVLSLPVGVIARLIPDELFTRRRTALPRSTSVHTTAAPDALPEPYQHTMQDVREQLKVFSALRGGRLKASQYHSGLAAAAVMPSLMASMVGIGLGFGQAASPVELRPVSPSNDRWREGESHAEELVAKSRERAMSLGLKNA